MEKALLVPSPCLKCLLALTHLRICEEKTGPYTHNVHVKLGHLYNNYMGWVVLLA